MSANEFNVDRVDSLANIASATPATNEKDKKRRNRQRLKNERPGEPDGTSEQVDNESNTGSEGHIIDFQA